MQISVVGTGSMANALIDRLIPIGHHVQVLSRDPQRLADSLSSAARTGPGTISVENVDQPPTGAVVILALPFQATIQYARKYGARLTNKIVVDMVNPIDFESNRMITPPVRSAAEYLAAALPPTASVVKAFNTTFASVIRTGSVAGQAVTVLVAGDSPTAKNVVGGLVIDMGLRHLDVGGLEFARTLEAMQFMHIRLQPQIGANFDNVFTFQRRN
jgi:hypothetical protein